MNIFTITFDHSKKSKAVYLQLYDYIIEEIRNGHLTSGERLPSKKQLCQHLNISQTTVENTYEMLVTEGYVRSVPRSGYYILPYEMVAVNPVMLSSALPDSHESLLPPSYIYNLSTGAVDTGVFPFMTWAKLSKEVMYHQPDLLAPGHNQGDYHLRQVIQKYLHEFRGVKASENQIILGAGTEYLLSLLCRILDRDHVFAMENPCYHRNYLHLLENRRKIVPIDVDESGIVVDGLKQSHATVVYVTPSHQYPTGVTMPFGRRMQLLQWASEHPCRYILEDDYDSEYRFSGRPIPALQGLDPNGKVIYLGTFSRSIAPSIRIAYMILPPSLLTEYQNRFAYCASTVSRFEQHTLCRFMEQGYYARHLNRTRTLYKRRKEHFVQLLKTYFPDGSYKIQGENLGLHFLLELYNGMSEEELIHTALQAGVNLNGLSHYYITRKKNAYPTLVMGYAGLTDDDLEQVTHRLCDAWNLNHT